MGLSQFISGRLLLKGMVNWDRGERLDETKLVRIGARYVFNVLTK